MKRLTLIRHGKSSWKHEVGDHERPLKKRATRDAKLVIAAWKQHLDEREPVFWTSSATRALESARMFREQLGIHEERFVVKDNLYTFDSEALKEIISSCHDDVDDLVVFGHNPAITELSNQLGHLVFDNVPTTGLVAMELQVGSWKELAGGKTLFYLFPKNLR